MKTSELIGPALDWAVAKACMDETVNVYFTEKGHKQRRDDFDFPAFNPSTDWAQGGPIIEREGIYVMPGCGTRASICDWDARIDDPDGEPWQTIGPTPLIAAMRCYVASRMGDDIEIPAELEG